nr:phage holin family protein [uncultured Albidiferax sp.]
MVPPLLRLIATQPQLLLNHAEAYAELLSEELGQATGRWKRRTALFGVALVCIAISAVLAGVGLMLWATTPIADIHSLWALLLAPVLPLLLAACCLIAARSSANTNSFDNMRQQIYSDMAMLREVGTL